ncbi:unnamed protein product [Rhizoctonia solani]|uniref:F-box domain-containing protein n=1 Tax=Rhizoctonia solani TaxID=456999 RepID=A0A8H3CL86_9AGAM|nr:unnamed protein product [Rhizoctonia solani]CAE6488582.1 unnamed protein product [Rhizoctonia solani]
MDKYVSWRGNRFWHNHDREGHLERLQILAYKSIFPSMPGTEHTIGRRGDVIPIPGSIPGETLRNARSSEDTISPSIKVDSCSALKLDIQSLHTTSRRQSISSPMSPIDLRIAELEASIVAERASRLSASPKILSNLRPEPAQRRSSLSLETGISRLPREISRKIVNLIEFRSDIATLSRVSRVWREETLPRLYSNLTLRGWDQIISCLATVCSADRIANLVVDLTLDTGAWPTHLNHEFYSIVRDALDRTRNLRRLVLLLDSDIVRVSLRTQGSDLRQRYDQTLGYDVSTILENCRFRLHHFVYEGPDALSCLETFLDFQSMIRTLQIPYRPAIMRSAFALPPHVTQLWLPLSGHANGFQYDNLDNISHLSIKGEPMPSNLEQFRHSPVHYLAHDVSSWTATKLMLPNWFHAVIPEVFSNLRILRLIDYWVTCETGDITPMIPPPVPTNMATELPEWGTNGVFPLVDAINPPPPVESEITPLGIGHFLVDSPVEPDKTRAPILRVESGLLNMLRHLPHLKALEVGGFIVRDAGQLRIQQGQAEFWLSQRVQWEEDFVHSVTSRAAKGLVAVSFLACDKPLFLSAFRDVSLSDAKSHRQWCAYLQRARSRVSCEAKDSGITVSKLIIRAGVQRWTGSAAEPSTCDYEIDSSFVPSRLIRDLSEEAIMSEWINMGPVEGWKRRTSVRNLRDIWPKGC